MTSEDVEELFETSNRQIREGKETFHRYLMSEIDWRDKLICIKGARGTGVWSVNGRALKLPPFKIGAKLVGDEALLWKIRTRMFSEEF